MRRAVLSILLGFTYFLVIPSTRAESGQCEKVIALSKTVRDTVKSESDFDAFADSFCSEYSKNEASRNKQSYGASYKFLSASIGKDNASESEIASKFCSAKSGEKKKDNAYREYVESISPNAYSAYERCKQLEQNGIFIDVDSAAILQKDLTIIASFAQGIAGTKVTMAYSSSPEISCKWSGGSTSKAESEIPLGAADSIQCSRSSAAQAGYIRVFAKNLGGAKPVTVNWPAFDANGQPIDMAKAMADRLQEATSKLSEISTSLHGAVLAFSTEQCPSGWEEYGPAQGRFVRGVDRTGTIDEDGKRAIGSIQGDQIASHSHSYELPTPRGRDGNRSGRQDAWYGGGNVTAGTGVFPDAAKKETRPKNVALLYCVRR